MRGGRGPIVLFLTEIYLILLLRTVEDSCMGQNTLLCYLYITLVSAGEKESQMGLVEGCRHVSREEDKTPVTSNQQ